MIVFSISLDEDTSQNYNFDTTEFERDSGMYLIFFVFTFFFLEVVIQLTCTIFVCLCTTWPENEGRGNYFFDAEQDMTFLWSWVCSWSTDVSANNNRRTEGKWQYLCRAASKIQAPELAVFSLENKQQFYCKKIVSSPPPSPVKFCLSGDLHFHLLQECIWKPWFPYFVQRDIKF